MLELIIRVELALVEVANDCMRILPGLVDGCFEKVDEGY